MIDKVLNHLLSGMRIVTDGFRNTKAGFTDLVMEIACALHNLRVDFRHPVPALDILELAA